MHYLSLEVMILRNVMMAIEVEYRVSTLNLITSTLDTLQITKIFYHTNEYDMQIFL